MIGQGSGEVDMGCSSGTLTLYSFYGKTWRKLLSRLKLVRCGLNGHLCSEL